MKMELKGKSSLAGAKNLQDSLGLWRMNKETKDWKEHEVSIITAWDINQLVADYPIMG